ncbi:MAG: right-handed parallel beta-helix repeat-containing protein [Myxococcaceae bacterium]
MTLLARRVAVPLGLAITLLWTSPANARDWFVREGSTNGNGSQASPFGDPWEALEKCEAGDNIHVTGGKYYGQLDGAVWKIPFPRISLYGGYDRDFKKRDPWTNLTELTFKPGSKNKPWSSSRIATGDDYSGSRIDGFVFNLESQNEYDDTGSLSPPKAQKTPLVIDQPGVVIANNIILNTSSEAMSIRPGVVVENNLIVNSVANGIRMTNGTTLRGDTNTRPAVVRNNTIAFTWDPKEAGTGGQRGAAIQYGSGAIVIEGNLLMNSDNQGLTLNDKPEEVTLKNNTFFQNLFSNVKWMKPVPVIIDDDTMDSLEDVGFKAVDGNEVANPKAKLPKDWMDGFSRRQGVKPGQVKMDEWNEFRRTLGLPLIATGGKAYEGFAPAWKLSDALALLDITAVKNGARRKPLTVAAFSEAGPATVQRAWQKAEVSAVAVPDAMSGKAVEIVVGLGQPAGLTYAKMDGVTPDTHEGTYLFDSKGEIKIMAAYKKGSAIARTMEQYSNKRLSSSGTPPALFIAKGVVTSTNMVPRMGVVLDSFEEQQANPADAAGPRPKGRDWFVRAGAKNGDGSKDKPFKDPTNALERAEAGDVIHVAEGEYTGKLRAAKFIVDMPFLTLQGGYDANFTERNPWKHPTVLRFVRDEKNSYGQGAILEGALDHRGTIVDGFVFDRRDYNKYEDDGDMMIDYSNKSESVWLMSPGSVVRNCTFVNGATGALMIGTASVVENNIFMNHVGAVVTVRRGDDNSPTVVRNNTILFSWNEKFGQGNVTMGYGIKFDTQSRGVADNNIIAFIDNHAVEVFGDPMDVTITNNVFSHNLWSNYETSPSMKFIDDATMASFPQAGLKAATGNVVQNPEIAFDPKWFDIYTNRTAPVPGKVAMDDWNQLRNIMGLSLIATGGKAGSGFAPMYDYKKALTLFPKKELKAGAHQVALQVRFDGIVREEPSFAWEDSDWDALIGDPGKLAGKRVAVKVSIRNEDNKYLTPNIDQAAYASWNFMKPLDSGRAKNVYVKRGSKYERVLRNAKVPGPGEKAKEVYVIKGTVQANGDLVADVIVKDE